MDNLHSYKIHNVWTGNRGTGTSDYRAYSRDHDLSIEGKYAPLHASADKMFRGDPARYNPEELLVAALSSCHMLSYLHLCAVAGISVIEYRDDADGTMDLHKDGSGNFTNVTLNPRVTITDASRIAEATALHHTAHEKCFIARSVNFPVEHKPLVTAALN